MPDALLATLSLTVFGVVGLALLHRRAQPSPDTTLSQPIHLHGCGSETTRPFRLAAGDYKLTCTLPNDVFAVVSLLDLQTGDEEPLFVGRECGAVGFLVAAGRYAVRVEPARVDAGWELMLSPLGLPSSRPQA